ncbi:Peptidase [Oryctes borbonicus]|uniref:tubulin-glutamate carboxypeptidase n=1 Tax=Oryctes borbonicus TaxID=1629725 RepID=A0A0T6BCC1_9SCAR|nr:Peptidase [Oryctes borbonicus]
MERLFCGEFEFFSNFDSANLAKVELVPQSESVLTSASNTGKSVVPELPDVEFNIWTKPDCCGTEFENSNRTWFYFGLRANSANVLVKINLVNLNKQAKMYSQGMAPVYRVLPGKPHWERIRDRPSYTSEETFTLSFKYRTPENVQSTSYFAFTYPFSYTDLQSTLSIVDNRFLTHSALLSKDDIYYVRECLCYSLEGRRVDLITISSYHNISAERETRLKDLFPEENKLRPFRFVGKKVIFISARVHPGETPSSFVFNGFLNLLTNRDDPVAIVLRRNYVFKLIPCLNPDGVAKGHYRTDTRGVNLNRVYLKPNVSLHPSVYAARALLRYHHYGYEKEEHYGSSESGDYESCQSEENIQVNDNKLSKKVSTMTLEENARNKNEDPETLCSKCKRITFKFDGLPTILPIFDTNREKRCLSSLGKDYCRHCGEEISDDGELYCEADGVYQPTHGDTNCNDSGLFLYVDMHGHASKKGIFMYGNHFDDLERNVECMLLPKLMSINNYNFHFNACNFTERNMYLKDRRDGMSREGSGRVAVLKMTGLIRSYTLECNYNTGRVVNVLPPTIKEYHNKGVHTLPVPPKYNPHVFEEVGKAMGASILDLTAQNPLTRLPSSEFHSLSGLREWLRIHCANEFGDMRTMSAKLKLRHSASLHAPQGKSVRAVVIKSRSTSAKSPLVTVPPKKAAKSSRSTSVPIDRKENMIDFVPQPCCSHTSSATSSISIGVQRIKPGLRPNKTANLRSRAKNLRGNISSDKMGSKASRKPPHTANLQRPKLDIAPKLSINKGQKMAKKTKEETDRVQLREICFIKDNEGSKKVIAKYNKTDNAVMEDSLIVSWDAGCSSAQVFAQKAPAMPNFLTAKIVDEPGTSKKGAFRVHNFSKHTSFTKVKRNKRNLRRLAGNPDGSGKIEKLKKRKKMKPKVVA